MELEQRALRWSAWGNVFFASLGIGFALLSRSDAILLDGFFSLVAFVMSLLTLKVARLVQRPDDERFQFGYYWFEPALNTTKGLLIFALCAFSLVGAIEALLHGGRELNVGPAIVYSLVAMAGAFLLAAVQRRAARKLSSPLIEVDARNWLIDGVLSVVVFLAFVGGYLGQGTGWAWLVPYLDPALVVLMVVLILPIPIGIVREGLGELLSIAPEEAIQTEVREKFAELVEPYGFIDWKLRMTKAGRAFYLLAFVVVDPESGVQSVAELDEVRDRIDRGMAELHPNWIVDTAFVADSRRLG